MVKHHAVLHRVFGRAVHGRAVTSNPCAHTELPKVIRKPKQIITSNQFDAILDNIHPRYQLMLLLAIETGLRWGELVALRSCDIDLSGHLVHVRRPLVEVSRAEFPRPLSA